MTIKLLAAWGEQPAGTLYTADDVTEAAMVAAQVATVDLAGSIDYVPPGGVTSPALNLTPAQLDALRAILSAPSA